MKKIDLTKIKSLFKKKQVIKAQGSHLNRDWNVFVIVVIFTIIFIIILNVYIFVSIQKGNIFNIESEDADVVTNIDQKLLKNTLKEYNNKIFKFENYKLDSSSVKEIN